MEKKSLKHLAIWVILLVLCVFGLGDHSAWEIGQFFIVHHALYSSCFTERDLMEMIHKDQSQDHVGP